MAEPKCPNCDGVLRRCKLGSACALGGYRHENGYHECAPRTGGTLFTFPHEALEDDQVPSVPGNFGLRMGDG